MFLMFPRNIFCVSATNCITRYNVSEVAKLRNIQDTCSTRQCSALHVQHPSLARPLECSQVLGIFPPRVLIKKVLIKRKCIKRKCITNVGS